MPVSLRSGFYRLCALATMLLAGEACPPEAADRLERIQYHNPGLVVDLGVGLWAWPLPMDYDRDLIRGEFLDGFTWFHDEGPLDDRVLAGHDTSPTTVDWDKNGIPDLLVGAEDGHLYYKRNPRTATEPRPAGSGPHPASDSARSLALAAPQVVEEDPADLPTGMLTREFLYEEAPVPGCHATTIAETPAGLLAAFFAGTDEGVNDVGIWVSRHLDGQWSPPVEVANGVQHSTLRHPCWNPVLFQHPGDGGVLQLYYKVGPSPGTWWGMLTESADHGKTWSWPQRLPQQIDGPVKNKPVLLPNGDLLCGSSTEYDGWTVHFEITPDKGRTWERIGPVTDRNEFRTIQPTILTHKNGTLQALCRSDSDRITTTSSTDNGRTWSPMRTTSLPNPDSGIDAVTLNDGRHLLIYNHTLHDFGEPKWRRLLNMAISEDGEHWKAALVVEGGEGEFSYPAVIQTSDGLVHITYTWRRKLLRHVVVDLAQLAPLQDIVAGRWPGLPHAGVRE